MEVSVKAEKAINMHLCDEAIEVMDENRCTFIKIRHHVAVFTV